MKKLFLSGLLLIAGIATTLAQCDKKVVVTSSKTQHLAADSTVSRTDDESDTVEFDKTTLNVTINGANGLRKMKGTVTSYTCDWSSPFKEGKTVLKASLTNDQGETRGLTIIVTGKGGKIGFLADVEGEEEKVRLIVDKFGEKL